MKTTITLIVHALLSISILSGQNAEADKAKEIMDAVAKFYSGVKTLSVDASMAVKQTIPEEFGGGDQDMSMTHTISLRRPDQLSIVTKGASDMRADAHITGGTVTILLDNDKVIKGEQKGTLADALRDERFGYRKEANSNMILDQNTAAGLLRGLLFHSEKDPWNKNINSMKHVGEVEIGDKKAEKLILVSKQPGGGPGGPAMEVDIELVVEKGDTPRLVSIQPDMNKLIKAMAESNPTLAKMKMEMKGSYSKWVVNEKLSDDAFKPVIPEGAKEYASLGELVEAMSGDPGAPGGGGDPKSLVGKDAEDIELAMLGSDDKFKLSSYKGKKIVILDFWATWCGPCVRALPILMEGAKEFADKDVILIGVNQQENPATIKSFLEKKDWDLKVVLDADGKAAGKYFVRGIPQTVIVGKDGKVKNVHVGLSPTLKDDLKKELGTLTSGSN